MSSRNTQKSEDKTYFSDMINSLKQTQNGSKMRHSLHVLMTVPVIVNHGGLRVERENVVTSYKTRGELREFAIEPSVYIFSE